MLIANIIYKLKDSEALILDATGIIFPWDYNSRIDMLQPTAWSIVFYNGTVGTLWINTTSNSSC
jgi:hypothetical protein